MWMCTKCNSKCGWEQCTLNNLSGNNVNYYKKKIKMFPLYTTLSGYAQCPLQTGDLHNKTTKCECA